MNVIKKGFVPRTDATCPSHASNFSSRIKEQGLLGIKNIVYMDKSRFNPFVFNPFFDIL
jgi:hypothetical protein